MFDVTTIVDRAQTDQSRDVCECTTSASMCTENAGVPMPHHFAKPSIFTFAISGTCDSYAYNAASPSRRFL